MKYLALFVESFTSASLRRFAHACGAPMLYLDFLCQIMLQGQAGRWHDL